MSTYRGVVTSPKPTFYSPTMSPIVDTRGNYPFKHSHANLFPAQQRPLSNVSEGEEVPIILSAVDDQIDDMITEIRPFAARDFQFRPGMLSTPSYEAENNTSFAVQHPPFELPQQQNYEISDQWQQPRFELPAENTYIFPALKEYPAFTPPVEGVQPFLFPVPRNEQCHAPVAMVTNLLQDVLGVMNTIMGEQGRVQEENQLLLELAELAAIMQEEAEALVELVDLVEEYVEEVDKAVELDELEDWVEGLERKQSPSPFRRTVHDREDSGVSMGDETDSGLSTSDDADSQKSILRLENSYSPRYPEKAPTYNNPVAISPKTRGLTEASEIKRPPTSRRPKKGIFTKKPQFRDSALGLLSPVRQRR